MTTKHTVNVDEELYQYVREKSGRKRPSEILNYALALAANKIAVKEIGKKAMKHA